MKYIYGKQAWKTFERGEENCWLMTNGLGGFSSLTVMGSCSRNDHAVLMACVHSPNHRWNMIHRLDEVLTVGDVTLDLVSQDYEEHEEREEGQKYLARFTYEDYPVWTYEAEGVQLEKIIAMMPGKNTVAILYKVTNRSGKTVELKVTPQLEFVPKTAKVKADQKFAFEGGENDGRYAVTSNGQTLYFNTSGTVKELPETRKTLYYAYDEADGRPETGVAVANHCVEMRVTAGEVKSLHLVCGMEETLDTVDAVIDSLTVYRKRLKEQAGFASETASTLALAADQFISHRESTGKQTILAGFPFFEDWGRDTMIALGGCCLAVRRYEEAKSILRTFMAYCDKGLMPNLFPEGKNAPLYNTVDAALLFVLSVYDYYHRTRDVEFLREAYPVMEQIVHWYAKGTDFSIKMDDDGLIMAGGGYDQVTWMDVRVGDILPTPRHGKPVEINAYWYNALCMMSEFSEILGVAQAKDYTAMAKKTRKSFGEKFWNEKTGCLRDVVSGTKADDQIRCNQIWAVAQPFSILSPEQEKQVVETVYAKLHTPYGLRTLDPMDAEFHPGYGGPQLERDLAYHQGTVWVFPMGAYYLAYLKVNGYSDEAKAMVWSQLEDIDAALCEGCIGQLPEIYSGENPVDSKGCFAQAWSVGEILRVYDALEKDRP
ncbi:MAG: glycogen debranching enzyme family protein [Lachnospiraceae bacterium]|nr:glycogen debranching enzyme family protein [Lachnospiraceae bacterium]